MKICANCGALFPPRVVIDGKVRNLNNRRFCLDCSPFGIHNSSKTPPGSLTPELLQEHRRRKRNAKTYRYQKKHRKSVKTELVAQFGGRCVDCGYAESTVALDFHHRDPSGKEFALSKFPGARQRLIEEAQKCDLICANCHRIRHAAEDALIIPHPVVRHRRATKERAVKEMGGICAGCGRSGPTAIFDFHHLDPTSKEFAISGDGIPRRWERIAAELAKCVMLCANCHREVHAGVRTIEKPGLAEEAARYAA